MTKTSAIADALSTLGRHADDAKLPSNLRQDIAAAAEEAQQALRQGDVPAPPRLLNDLAGGYSYITALRDHYDDFSGAMTVAARRATAAISDAQTAGRGMIMSQLPARLAGGGNTFTAKGFLEDCWHASSTDRQRIFIRTLYKLPHRG